jgi:hypothetical protein
VQSILSVFDRSQRDKKGSSGFAALETDASRKLRLADRGVRIEAGDDTSHGTVNTAFFLNLASPSAP